MRYILLSFCLFVFGNSGGIGTAIVAALPLLPIVNTNLFYIPDTAGHRQVGGVWVVDERAKAIASRALESRPAVDDPGGNWGLPTYGLQCSIRLEKETFEIGEAVKARVTIRNLGDHPQLLTRLANIHGIYRLIVTRDPNNQMLHPARDPAEFGLDSSAGVSSGYLYPGYQRREGVTLTDIFQFDEPGAFYVTANRINVRNDEGNLAQIASGNARFTISAPLRVIPPSKTVAGDHRTSRGAGNASNGISPVVPNSPALRLIPVETVAPGNLNKDELPTLLIERPHRTAQNKAGPGTPLLAEAGTEQPGRSRSFAVLLFLSLGLIGFILFRAYTRNSRKGVSS